ncbi:hypothetical protein [Nodosilinea sp. E11]|nr:hypothetical protein [Nodosilinea sp. E11]WOD40928.1 hypothetical protein RRF56_08995 [Nodosilinea sp. E11]
MAVHPRARRCSPMMMVNDLWVPLALLSLIIAAAIAFSRTK